MAHLFNNKCPLLIFEMRLFGFAKKCHRDLNIFRHGPRHYALVRLLQGRLPVDPLKHNNLDFINLTHF